MKSLKTSTACSSPLTTDVCKENKERHTTNKPSISYGKKEKSNTVSLGRKKGKVFDVIASTSTAPPIPTKRQKVVVNKKFATNDKVEPKESSLDLDMNALNSLNLKLDDSATVSAQNVASSASAEDLTAFIDQPTTSFDPNMPCCSYQILPQTSSSFNPFKYPNAPKKASNFLRKTNASTPMLINQSSIMQSTKIKSCKVPKLRSGFSGAGPSNGGSRLKSLRKSSLIKDGLRMKKKKTLKADSSMKRKKSKVF